ncbi:AMP-binding protein [Nocardioides sp. J2M5]|uniref:AMP-binding protein n=1 Tax=Nocardioides palaemonis TaxID=2829810 RepID=UPI001BA959A3|nr:AMP-binding protein [Nocardioides palaemonis]MBS2939632.1 AMP-binding protein [Nocardioides palaemonis]
MAYVPVSRAAALPGGDRSSAAQSPRWTVLSDHALLRGDRAAHLLVRDDEVVIRPWSETARAVELAAAGLVRSGLRVDQVVVSLVPPGHACPELDLALRAIGAVVVHVDPHAGPDDLLRELSGVDVRLVVVEEPRDLQRLPDLSFPSAELFALDGGRGWDRLLELGAQRLTMDPDAVTRVDRAVDPEGAVPRLLGRGRPTGRVPAETTLPEGVVAPDDVVLLACGPADPLSHLVRDAHLAGGAALAELPAGSDLLAVLARVSPSVLVLSGDAVRAVVAALDPGPAPRPRRVSRRRPAPEPEASPLGDRLRLVVVESLDAADRAALAATGVDVLEVGAVRLAPADLPVPPPVLRGDAADLPRRSRHDPGADFQLAVDRAPAPVAPDESAFVLPSLPLFGGESFLDKLLLARAREAEQ